MTIRRKLILWIAGPTLVIYVVVLGLTLGHLVRRNREAVERTATRFAAHYAGSFDELLREAAGIAESTARTLEIVPDFSKAQLYSKLRANVKQNSIVFGAALAFEPGAYPGEADLFAPYVCRDGDGLREMNIDRNVYDWYADQKYTWFRAPKAAGHGVWSDPYFDDGAGNILMCTFSTPFFRDGVFQGVATVDIDLIGLREKVGRDITDRLDFVILTTSGRYVYSPNSSRIMKKTMFDIARELNRPELEDLARRITSGKAGVMAVDDWDAVQPVWVFHAPIRSVDWGFACRVPEREVLADARSRTTFAAAALSATLLLIVGCIVAVAGFISRPIARLTEKVLEVAQGNLEARLEQVSGNDEVAVLVRSFNQMTGDLRNHVDTLAEERAQRQKIERDLDIARQIQRGLLPVGTPELPGFDIAGWSQPADKTGGDYYDWQRLPDGRLAISVADVTGHGIGPALVTAVCRAYSRASFPEPLPLRTIMDRVNDLLVDDLSDGRFVTFVVAILNPTDGTAELASAGHGPLLLYRAAEDVVITLDAQGIPFGIAAGFGYGPSCTIPMAAGDAIILLTDGFFEWANAAGELFGIERLRNAIQEHGDVSSKELIAALYRDVLNFAGGTHQLDDLTAVVVRRRHPQAADV